MSPDKQDFLYSKYPKLFKRKDCNMMESCMCWGLEIGDGWFKIIDNLCEKLDKHDGVVVEQVKSKFGLLRFYIDFESSFTGSEINISNLISEAEACSRSFDEFTGEFAAVE
jgi:hypothetical protein